MKHDMLSLFNQLTSKELADCNFFNNLIELHYEKFKYLYYILKETDFDDIQDISCNDNVDSITITLVAIDAATLFNYIDKRKTEYPKHKYFKTSLFLNDNTVSIVISMFGIQKEADMYANRLI